jgi:hypothetical protein
VPLVIQLTNRDRVNIAVKASEQLIQCVSV